ncbi:bifunctional folylpolyglutamate synthase/dihydrofolate synthase [Psychrobacillus vulpis]|uniref:tetrahydrofolate synthase n=1 Tax=Psychrobacillus vulpis TaxID=2325572 RepID=A0A544TP08_9BACI|nr:folylpolyglutamate synthase/dihydrofolate synthase family protein [Psychrobacillus vulpis]TQR19191.1 bifunctional folylpolyglutamate synthase/dihydrofolate synthase [Psychrobacillus vulpis]
MEITNFYRYKKKWNIESENTIKPGLESIQKAMIKLGNPQNRHRVIHVAGTNGKGSTIAFLSALAKEHGLTYGSFTSPCIIDVHDQIQINGQNVTVEQMDRAFQKMQLAELSGKLTNFELLTVTAFLVFELEDLDVVFIEAGMGGRFDSTNIMENAIAVIPSISIDHTNFLGDTIEKISWHKAGILKESGKLVIGKLLEGARNVIFQEANEKNTTVIEYTKDFKMNNHNYTYKNIQIANLYPQMIGTHQLSNMALALTAFIECGFILEESSVRAAVQRASLRGRMEKVWDNVYFDGAHNEASIDALVETMRIYFQDKQIHFIVGVLKDKDYLYMLRKLEDVGSSFEFVDFQHERALSASELLKHCSASQKHITKDMEKIHFKKNDDSNITIVTGSLYFLTEVRRKTGK